MKALIKHCTLLLIITIVIASQFVSADSKAPGDYWVFIGDSYLSRGKRDHTSIPDYMASMMGIKKYENHSRSGASFARKSNKFIWQVKWSRRNRKVTDVLIHGGIMNDYRTGCDLMSISTGFEKLIKEVRYTYPNARIWYVSMPFNIDAKEGPKLVRIHNLRYRWYKYLAAINDVTVIKGVRFVLPRIPSGFFHSDCIHPRRGARRIIARTLSKRIMRMCS